MCKWNLIKLSEALESLIPEAKEHVTNNFDMEYSTFYIQEFQSKLGIKKQQIGDLRMYEYLISTLKAGGYDWTNFFRILSGITIPDTEEDCTNLESIQSVIDSIFELRTKKSLMCKRKKPQFAKMQLMKLKEIMDTQPELLKYINADPKFIEKELQKDEEYTKLVASEESELDKETRESLNNFVITYRKRLFQDFMNRDEQELTLEEFNSQRVSNMLKTNPKFILRNHLAQECIKKAEEGDYSMIDGLLKVLESPFDEHDGTPDHWSAPAPESAYDLCVSCSS